MWEAMRFGARRMWRAVGLILMGWDEVGQKGYFGVVGKV